MGIELTVLTRYFAGVRGVSLIKWAVPAVTFVVWASWPAIPTAVKSKWTLGLIRDHEGEAAAAAAAADAASEDRA
ncbi:hypothetical protein FNF27_04610 [Cafeteria roenbergensis]|uniref:Uncharacterized protein n=1 Tax=Cafeteria roenbergensis TaxID=33653 RepID=A0A5A8DFZ2_CAFRO|nr:hypothetical protein FNF28_05084 [Cafeteria roenbergensis]KAA0163090.1 hypothetical protein FNF31_02913 [Cafeteria roenbergensis]KAA0173853.1 hypothetical protein FNF27_04610 [Cafeteria roenbergensis]